jgi:hypothetical protein
MRCDDVVLSECTPAWLGNNHLHRAASGLVLPERRIIRPTSPSRRIMYFDGQFAIMLSVAPRALDYEGGAIMNKYVAEMIGTFTLMLFSCATVIIISGKSACWVYPLADC